MNIPTTDDDEIKVEKRTRNRAREVKLQRSQTFAASDVTKVSQTSSTTHPEKSNRILQPNINIVYEVLTSSTRQTPTVKLIFLILLINYVENETFHHQYGNLTRRHRSEIELELPTRN